MNKFIGKMKILWFLVKAIFSTNVELDKSNKDTGNGKQEYNWKKYQNTVQDFLDKYDVNAEDRIDYNNTRKHHYNNFDHLDNPDHPEFKDTAGGDRVLERKGLIYEKDGKTPLNPAEVFDMTYEEYSLYKKKILPRAETKKITFNDIKRFVERERGVQGVPKKKAPNRTSNSTEKRIPGNKKRWRPRKKRRISKEKAEEIKKKAKQKAEE